MWYFSFLDHFKFFFECKTDWHLLIFLGCNNQMKKVMKSECEFHVIHCAVVPGVEGGSLNPFGGFKNRFENEFWDSPQISTPGCCCMHLKWEHILQIPVAHSKHFCKQNLVYLFGQRPFWLCLHNSPIQTNLTLCCALDVLTSKSQSPYDMI